MALSVIHTFTNDGNNGWHGLKVLPLLFQIPEIVDFAVIFQVC